MSIRLNKALRELNIGLQTAVEFLEKRSDLGEVKAEPSFKLSDAQYAALAGAFQQDKEVRSQAEKLLQKKPKEKKRSEETQAEPLLKSSTQQQYKPLGKIDLDSLNKKPAQKKPATPETHKEPQAKTNAVSQKPATNSEAPQKASTEAKVDNQNKNQNTVGQNKEHKQEKKQEAAKTVVNNTASAPKKVEAAEKPAEAPKTETGIFTTKSEKKILNAPKVNVLGKIDLSTLNQSTRPKKKSKEEKRKEREDKAQQQRGDKKKRERINKVRVDINAASNQPNGGNNNGGKQNGGGNAGTSNKNKKKNRNRGGQQKPAEVNDEDVARQVKETLARLTNKQNQNKKGAKYRKEKREAAQEKMNEELREEKKESKTLKLTEFVTVSELATMMNVSVNQVIGTLMSVGIMVSINQRLDAETINLVAEEFDFKTEYVSAEVQEAITEVEDDENDLVPRAPIVTVMGHVDHGKTSLLDHIRNTNVIAGEAGGITQHIGAYNVKLKNGQHITFLDTPGHEAFTAMRARGAKVTDIAIIIVAADDAVMPQTVEAINHAQAAGVPMIFAINKCDKPGANPDKIKEQLSNMNILVEDWGGPYQSQDISAKTGAGVYELLEKVLLEAEMLDLKANPKRRAKGSIIESSLDKGRGYVATVLVSDGTLHMGDIVLAGTYHGKIKAMFNERGQRIQQALPGEPCLILGLNGAPQAGDEFNVLPTEQEAREIANKREQLQREQSIRTKKHVGLDEIGRRLAIGDFKELNIIVKGDVDGSVEALSDSLIKLSTENIQVNVIHGAVGAISDSDVLLAAASDAIIVGFNVRPTATARKMADSEEVDIRIYSIIYDAIEEIKAAMAGMLSPEIKEEVTATLEVLQTFHISKVGTIAGCIVREGKAKRANKCRVIRDGIVIHTGELSSLKHGKDDIKEAGVNTECGLSIKNFNDVVEGDLIETFEQVEVAKSL